MHPAIGILVKQMPPPPPLSLCGKRGGGGAARKWGGWEVGGCVCWCGWVDV